MILTLNLWEFPNISEAMIHEKDDSNVGNFIPTNL